MDEKEINRENYKENLILAIFIQQKKMQIHEMKIQYLEKKLKRIFGDENIDKKHPLYKKV